MKRRTFIKAAAAATASLSLTHLSACKLSSKVDVVVIGAGLSGLSAARELVKNDVSVLVVEARSRVGGRTYNQPVNTSGAIIDGGGQWVGPTQSEILALAGELKITIFDTWNEGEAVGLFEGQRLVGTELDSDPETVEDLERVIGLINEMVATVPLQAPWDAVNANSWDAQYLGDWLDENTRMQGARDELEAGVASILDAASSQISLLWFLFYVRSAGSYQVLQSIEGGAQQYRFVEGAQQISIRMAQELGKRRIILGEPVQQIASDQEHVYVQLSSGIVEAKQVIVAMMPADAEKITFSPPLPHARSSLQTNWATSSGFKIHIVYPSAFWREAGLSGQATTDTGVSSVFDNSPASGTPGILIVFAEAGQLPNDKMQRMQQVVGTLVQLFGNEAATPVEYIEMDWAKETFTEGCESPLGINVLTRYGHALRPPTGRIYWAGTEAALVWNGYMEGAIRAGKQAAVNVIAGL